MHMRPPLPGMPMPPPLAAVPLPPPPRPPTAPETLAKQEEDVQRQKEEARKWQEEIEKERRIAAAWTAHKADDGQARQRLLHTVTFVLAVLPFGCSSRCVVGSHCGNAGWQAGGKRTIGRRVGSWVSQYMLSQSGNCAIVVHLIIPRYRIMVGPGTSCPPVGPTWRNQKTIEMLRIRAPQVYYYNTVTEESSWEKPAGYKPPAAAAAAGADERLIGEQPVPVTMLQASSAMCAYESYRGCHASAFRD